MGNLCCVTRVSMGNKCIVKKNGKFKTYEPGFHCIGCLCCGGTIYGSIETQLKMIKFDTSATTKDGMFVRVTGSVQYALEDIPGAHFHRLPMDPTSIVEQFVMHAIKMHVMIYEFVELKTFGGLIEPVLLGNLVKDVLYYGYEVVYVAIEGVIADVKKYKDIKEAMVLKAEITA